MKKKNCQTIIQYTDKLYNLCRSLNIIRIIKSRRLRCVEQIAWMECMRNSLNILIGKLETKVPLGRPRRVRESSIKILYIIWIGLIWLGIETSSGPSWAQHSTLGYITMAFLTRLFTISFSRVTYSSEVPLHSTICHQASFPALHLKLCCFYSHLVISGVLSHCFLFDRKLWNYGRHEIWAVKCSCR
jgi:hypothetical protein